MKKIKKNYTNFILTVIAIAMIGILFKGQVIKPAHAGIEWPQVNTGSLGQQLYQLGANQVKLGQKLDWLVNNCN